MSGLIVATSGGLGAVVASYVTTAALRATDEAAPEGGRSACDSCHRQLRWWELVPVASFVGLRGRCRTCAGPITPYHPIGECVGLLVGVAIAIVAPDYRAVGLAILSAALLGASVIDARVRILPDLLVATIAVAGTGLAAGHGFEVWVTGVIAAVLSLIILGGLSYLYERRRGLVGLGYGDVKLVAALALWLGEATSWMVLSAAVLGMAVLVIWRPADRKIALGPMIAAAGLSIGLCLEVGLWPRL